LLQQQPNGLLIQSQALGNQLTSQPNALHRQLSFQQIGTLQQQVPALLYLSLDLENTESQTHRVSDAVVLVSVAF